MRLVRVDELQEGMIIAEDIVGKYDIMLLTSGTIISYNHIENLRKLDIKFVYVMEKEIEDEEIKKDDIIIIDREINKEYNKTMDSFKNVYKSFGSGKKMEVEVVEQAITPLIAEVVKNNNVLGRLRQIEVNDEYTYKHSVDVCMLATMMGKWMGYSEDELRKLSMSALLHDIGKAKIPIEILNKPDKLTVEEFEIIKKHTVYGYEMAKCMPNIHSDVFYGILQHHERMDGSGYPFGVKGDKIHEYAKIIGIADVFDAMTSNRVYKEKESPFKVAELIVENSFGILDPVIANVFLSNISKFYVGNIVKLNTGQTGEIILVNRESPTRPLVKINEEFVDLSKDYHYEIVDVIA
ncbi:MAG: HD-GYP domain-containing protein [Bacillota bacterium]